MKNKYELHSFNIYFVFKIYLMFVISLHFNVSNELPFIAYAIEDEVLYRCSVPHSAHLLSRSRTVNKKNDKLWRIRESFPTPYVSNGYRTKCVLHVVPRQKIVVKIVLVVLPL